MWRWRRSCRSAALSSVFSHLRSSNIKPLTYNYFQEPKTLPNLSSHFVSLPFSSSSPPTTLQTKSPNTVIDDDDEEEDDDELHDTSTKTLSDPKLLQNIETILNSLRNFESDAAGAKHKLENCGAPVSHELVSEVLSRLRNDWGAAFTFFLWATSRPGFSPSVPNYHSIIATLAKMGRFNTAWSVLDEMRTRSLVNPQTLLIMIRKYCAAHDVAKAISVFYSFKKYGFKLEIDEFQGLLSALCRYKNVEDAEHLLFCNVSTFPFETKSFNIVLNGWCNVLVYVREAKRFWREMSRRGVDRDVVSYGSMISCFSKAGNLNDVLKLFNQMEESGIEPDLRVYNAVIYALAKGKCVEQAKNLVSTMETKGIAPNAVTYNSLVRPLCKARKLEDARNVFDEMLSRGISPSARTYHAFFDVFTTVEDVFDLLDRMERAGCMPVSDTYIMLIRKLSRWRQFESVFKLWEKMRGSGMSPDRSAYIVLIHGLFLNGKLEDAFKYYEEMKAKGFAPEPKTEEMIQAWVSGKQTKMESLIDELKEDQNSSDLIGKKSRAASSTSPHKGSPRRHGAEMKRATK